jgi:hypothetical protein
MVEASAAVLDGKVLKIGFDPDIIYPSRYQAEGDMWQQILEIRDEI